MKLLKEAVYKGFQGGKKLHKQNYYNIIVMNTTDENMGFFGKIKKGLKSAAAAHKKDDVLVREFANIYQEQGYPVSGMKKKAAGVKTKKDGVLKKVPERYSFVVTTANGVVKIKTKSESGTIKASTKLGGMKGKKDKFKVDQYVHNDGGKLTIRNRQELGTRVMGLL